MGKGRILRPTPAPVLRYALDPARWCTPGLVGLAVGRLRMAAPGVRCTMLRIGAGLWRSDLPHIGWSDPLTGGAPQAQY